MTRILARRFAALLAVALLAGLLAGCKTELYTNISEPEANEMLSVLAAAGIRATKETSDSKVWTVMAEENQIPKALEALRAQGLPRDRHQSLGDIFKKEGLVSTPSEERIRYMYAMEQELSRTLSQIDGVITARVHVVIPANDPLAEHLTPSSASVFIKHRPSLNVREITPAIKQLVQRSIEGLKYENISVLFFPADTFEGKVPPEPWFYDLYWYQWAEMALLALVCIFIGMLLHPGSREVLLRIGAMLRVAELPARLRTATKR